jgi:hypothetical protein
LRHFPAMRFWQSLEISSAELRPKATATPAMSARRQSFTK